MRKMLEVMVMIPLCALLAAPVAAQGAAAPARGGAQARPPAQSPARAPGQAPARGGQAADARQPASPPYITGDATALYTVMAPAPRDGDARDQADRRIFRETRVLAGTPRWEMAIGDAQLGNAVMLQHFACSLGVQLEPDQAPRLVALLQKTTREAARSMGKAKEVYKRKRPFQVQEGPTCVDGSTIGESFDYPSGHTTAGWAWAMVLSQADPEHAGAILARGRAIGDSRVVCGMHNASAVENARMLTGAAVSLASASALYQADLAYARAELATVRGGEHGRPDPARCAQEEELVKFFW